MSGNLLTLVSVNVGLPQTILLHQDGPIVSAIAKKPVGTDFVTVRKTNLDGDKQADLRVHGGADKAVYAYSADNWPWWNREHGLQCVPATFGENLTLTGGDESTVRIGDRFRWGESLVEVSQPRAPCYKFGIHTGRADAPSLMTTSARCGWYLRVLEEGRAPTRGQMTCERTSDAPTVRDAFIAVLHPSSRELCVRVHDAPALAEAWRVTLAKKIARMRG